MKPGTSHSRGFHPQRCAAFGIGGRGFAQNSSTSPRSGLGLLSCNITELSAVAPDPSVNIFFNGRQTSIHVDLILCQKATEVYPARLCTKVFHGIRTASGSDRPNTQLLERNLMKLMGV
jgi:hypothetical protein